MKYLSLPFCVYYIRYNGNKLPPKLPSTRTPKIYIGSTDLYKIQRGYNGSVTSKRYKNIWNQEWKENRHCFDIRILKTFEERNQAKDYEFFLLQKFNAANNPLFVNMHAGKNNFNRAMLQQSIAQYDLDGYLINIYDSVADAGRKIKSISYETINMAANGNGGTITAGGYIWIKNSENKYEVRIDAQSYILGRSKAYNREQRVACYSLEGKFIKKYTSLVEASLDIAGTTNSSSISSCINGRMSSAFGYRWAAIKIDSIIPNQLEELTYQQKSKGYGVPVNVYKNGSLVGTFKTYKDAADFINVGRDNVSRAARGIQKSVKGFEVRII